MNWKLALSLVALGCASLAAPGCAADAASVDEADAEEAGSSQDEINAAQQKLVGAFHASGGSVRPPTFRGLVFQADGTFFADVDTGIRCITTPCPSQVRMTGKFSATRNYVRLLPTTPTAPQTAYHGRYKYTLVGDKLTLSTRDGWSNSLDKETSYCMEANDCWGQNLIHPMCMGGWVCGGGINNQSSNQCGWECGNFPPPPPASEILPADATTLVAQTSGGGFTPPPPPGSTCAMGAAKYSLDIATKKVAYETCEFVDWQTPLTKQSGTKTLTAVQLTKVLDAAKAMKITTRTICGADKPLLKVIVTSPSQGEKTYKDSFYSCDGAGPFVDDIDGVFSAFRSVTGQ